MEAVFNDRKNVKDGMMLIMQIMRHSLMKFNSFQWSRIFNRYCISLCTDDAQQKRWKDLILVIIFKIYKSVTGNLRERKKSPKRRVHYDMANSQGVCSKLTGNQARHGFRW